MGKRSLKIWFPAVRAGSGADVFIERLAQALATAGHEPVVQWFEHRYELTPWQLRKVQAPAGVDIVHANSWQAFAFKRAGIPLVVTEHHYVLDPGFRSYKSAVQHVYHRTLVGSFMRRSFAAADRITTDSRFTADVLARSAGVQVSGVIPLWVDYQKFSPAEHLPVSKAGQVFRLLYVGNASRRKGADIIPALAEQLGPGFEIRCTAGLRATTGIGAGANVTVLGRRSQQELIDEYRQCDAVLVPSRYEGFGYAALEAMACAKPVVGFSCGAVDEVVVDGESALLCRIDDVDALAVHCRRLAENRDLAREMGRRGRQRAVSVFTETDAVDAYVALYRSLVGA
ncbi:glycosyltransferase family 4 protein [Dyella sp. C9]|uniref:glycosyltransferase family 4 protein n=1 Tax=Dyella sp. C9 TaxID=2202154 RepID=UPI0018E4EEB8|nr:glycosyltransferase family 4 protein [Dyella sp. C9]